MRKCIFSKKCAIVLLQVELRILGFRGFTGSCDWGRTNRWEPCAWTCLRRTSQEVRGAYLLRCRKISRSRPRSFSTCCQSSTSEPDYRWIFLPDHSPRDCCERSLWLQTGKRREIGVLLLRLLRCFHCRFCFLTTWLKINCRKFSTRKTPPSVFQRQM